MAKLSNPLAFTRGPVTFWTTLIYLAIGIVLILVHTGVPSAPISPTPIHGVNLTEAWLDLQLLTSSYHPYNSHENDQVHDWLVKRLRAIVKDNKSKSNTSSAYIFDDNVSNQTFSSSTALGTKKDKKSSSSGGLSVYFESKNIIAYVPGKEDDKSGWWKDPNGKPSDRNGVLVNAHYDSVSSGFGATDDGVGVISIMQLLRYYTTPGNQPKHGLVLLLNDGEEDFLNGARVFLQHPMAKLVSSFLNLEGAGAGGRAPLFRSTDTEITRAYGHSPHPFGSVVSADGFSAGLIRSQTDYVIFNGIQGLRGLDVAFMEPRARYHTNQDDSRHTNVAALWHMLSGAVATTKQLTSQPLKTNLDPEDNPGSQGVWFDLFGRVFAVFQAHTMFSLSVTLLVAGPLILLATILTLYASDKLYMFSNSRKYHLADGDEKVSLYGLRGLFRTPIVLLFACAAPLALAYLLTKENEFIVHSSEWAVWSMMGSSFVFVAWFLSRTADFARPSSLTRAYALTWMWAAWWVVLVAGVVLEERRHLSGVYFVMFFTATLLVATWLSYLEMFSLPKKGKYCLEKMGATDADAEQTQPRADSNARASTSQHDEATETEGEDEEATEQTSLLAGGSAYKKYNQSENDDAAKPEKEETPDRHQEQEWSTSQWSWLWILQFIVLMPINLIVVGQIALTTVGALHQTGPDGSSLFFVYLLMAVFSIILFSPLVPSIHRLSWHVPIFLLLVLVGTLAYNLVAFPFSESNRLKLFFQQSMDLDTGANNVSIIGVEPFVSMAVTHLPSAVTHSVSCEKSSSYQDRTVCSWEGLPPNVVSSNMTALKKSSMKQYKTWLAFNATNISKDADTSKVRFKVAGKNTRACKLVFDSNIRSFRVHGSGPADDRMPPVPKEGSKEIRLWSRIWDRQWTVDVKWDNSRVTGKKMTGQVVCMWSDANEKGVIPAYDEAEHYFPGWVAVTKAGDGLVEGYKSFKV